MKRFFTLFLSIVLLSLSACSVQRFSDVKMFERNFNKQLVRADIDVKDAIITNSNSELQYNFILSPDGKSDFLIRLYTSQDDFCIKRCTVTVSASVQDMNKDMITTFREICQSVTTVFSNSKDNPTEVFDTLFMPNAGSFTHSVPQYTQTRFFRYTYSANNTGAYFCIENKSLCPETEPELTLRSYEGVGE